LAHTHSKKWRPTQIHAKTAVARTTQDQHDHAVCERVGVQPMAIIGLLSLCLVGLFIWALGVFIVVAGNAGLGFSLVPFIYFPLFFALVCALVPFAHTSRLMASIAFWWTVLTCIFGWSLIIEALRQANDADCDSWDCRSTILSIAGAAILLFALTLLCMALFFYNVYKSMLHEDQVVGVHTQSNAPTGVVTTGAQRPEAANVYLAGTGPLPSTQQKQTSVDIESTTQHHDTGDVTYQHKTATVTQLQEDVMVV